jgi:hypothetical protein
MARLLPAGPAPTMAIFGFIALFYQFETTDGREIRN